MPDNPTTPAPMWLMAATVAFWPCTGMVLLSFLLIVVWPCWPTVYFMEFFAALMMVTMTIATIGNCWRQINDA